MTKIVTILVTALLITAGDATGQSTGTDRQLNRLINETNALLGESKDLLHDAEAEHRSLLRLLLNTDAQESRIKRKANALRRTLRTNIVRFREIKTECGAIANKIERTSWPSLSGDPKMRGSFAQRAMENAKNCARNAQTFADGLSGMLRTMVEVGL